MRLIDYFNRQEKSTKSLIASNVFVILLAVIQNWKIDTVIWIYWSQSVIIGLVNIVRILDVKDLKLTEDDKKAHRKVNIPLPFSVKAFFAGFFAIHYGLFHFGYGVFATGFFTDVNINYIILASVVFFVNHTYSFIQNRIKDQGKQDFGRIFIHPYQRIAPMHLTIMLGAFVIMFGFPEGQRVILLIFLSLKAIVDVRLHIKEHS